MRIGTRFVAALRTTLQVVTLDPAHRRDALGDAIARWCEACLFASSAVRDVFLQIDAGAAAVRLARWAAFPPRTDTGAHLTAAATIVLVRQRIGTDSATDRE